MSQAPLLGVEGLTAGFNTEQGPVRVVEDVSFALEAGDMLGLVGESGCGKSVTAQTIMRLRPRHRPASTADASCSRARTAGAAGAADGASAAIASA
jgi:ABC-type glutathione transport system ATPase component